jgi:hypothetical protein
LLLCGFAKFRGQTIFDGEEWVLDGFILGRNWQWCQLKVFPQGNVDFPIDFSGTFVSSGQMLLVFLEIG